MINVKTTEMKIERKGAVAVVPKSNAVADIKTEPFLIIRRSSKVLAPNTLCFPGGGIEPDETPQEAVQREFQEELGVSIRDLRAIWENITPWNVQLVWFLAFLDDPSAPFLPNPNEVSEVVWLTLPDLLLSQDCLQSNRPFLQKVLNGSISLFV